MHIQSCLNPKLVRHPFTGEQMYVPCGSCAVCIQKRSSRWVQRLQQERYSWKYAFFFTLTYAPENRPILYHQNGTLVDLHHRLTPPTDDVIVVDLLDINKMFNEDLNRFNTWFSAHDEKIAVLSSYDLSKFIKRFRTYAIRDFERSRRSDTCLKEKEKPEFRYFAIGEYGPTLLAPHYHGLFFFNSEFLCSHFGSLLDKAWKFGITDYSSVSEDNASYVARYLNCTSHLPSIYRYKYFRPFFLCSKFPPLGTLCHSSKEVREMFFACSPEQVIFDHRRSVFDNVPLWRTYIDRLYPRLSAFSSLSHFDRIALYGLVKKQKLTEFFSFRQYVEGDDCRTLIKDYVSYFKTNCSNYIAALQRWFYISSRVCKQAESFEISVKDYVYYIEKFYDNLEKQKLKLYYEFQDDYSQKNVDSSLIGCDKLYLQSLLDIDYKSISDKDLIILNSYGVDVNRFFHPDENVRREYQQSLLPDNTFDFECLSLDAESWQRLSMKTKKKNDYLALNPELEKFIY